MHTSIVCVLSFRILYSDFLPSLARCYASHLKLTLCTVFRLFVRWLKPNSMLAYIGADVVV
jgi:hypothetical protein